MASTTITINYQQHEGFGGQPLWYMWGWMEWSDAGRYALERDLVPEDRLKLVALPNTFRLAAMRTDGAPLTLITLTPPGITPIMNCVLIGPLQYGPATPVQPAGTYSGKRLCEWACRAQQLE